MSEVRGVSRHWVYLSIVWQWTQKIASYLIVIAIAAFGFLGGHLLFPEKEEATSSEVEHAVEPSSINLVEIGGGKSKAMNLRVAPVKKSAFQATLSVPAIIDFDQTHLVKVRATTDCRVAKLWVQPFEHVEAGQPLIALSAPAVGAARNEITRSQNKIELLEKAHGWTQDTHGNISNLLTLLETHPTTQEIETKFKNKNLGEHRNDLLSAYSALLLALKKSERIDNLSEQGAISGREADARRAELETAKAKYNSIREEMQFQIKQGLRQSEIAVESEKRILQINQRNLAALTGADGKTGVPEKKSATNEFTVVSPRRGQVVDLKAVESARFETGEEMITIAEMNTLWVEAQISQEDVARIQVQPGTRISVQIPSHSDQQWAAVKFVGSTVSDATLAVPLIAELDNIKGNLRSGMSVRVDVPVSRQHEAIVVPVSAVQRIDMEPVVFVRLTETKFEVRKVKLGLESRDMIEVVAGLSVGDQVVTQGAFFLKSELLLSAEE